MKAQKKLLVLMAALLLLASSGFAKEGPHGRSLRKVQKVADGPTRALQNANNITTWAQPNGFFYPFIASSWNGEFPRGSGVGVIYQEGIVFGGKVNDGLGTDPRIEGDTYEVGMQPGKILTDATGNAIGTENADDPSVNRIWAVRSDCRPGQSSDQVPDLASDVAGFQQVSISAVTSAQKSALLQEYYNDWNDWPAAKGAPWYVDTVGIVRNDGAFDPTNSHHIPGMPGANKTVWFVCNDANSAITTTFYGSQPIGIEEQMTLWSYASTTALNNMIFKQVKLIYKGVPGLTPPSATIDSMYVVQWADGDLGDYNDDFAGSDSTLNLGYQYNSGPVDAKFAAVGLPAPAVGYVFLQGISHPSGNPADSAVVNLQWRHGYKYDIVDAEGRPRPLTAYDYFAAGTSISDPDFAADAGINGSYQWFNLMRGYLPRPMWPNGEPFYQSSGYASSHGIVTSYCLSGDPVTGTGWIDGVDVPAGDRRMVNVHGPVTISLHDTAEVVVALIGAMGTDNISSVQLLKNEVSAAQSAYDRLFILPSVPSVNPTVSNLTNEVILNWGDNSRAVAQVESNLPGGYTFEGYQVFQLPTASTKITDPTAVKIAQFDVVDTVDKNHPLFIPEVDVATGATYQAIAFVGTNSGIQRTLDIKTDNLKKTPLVNGQTYYFAVVAVAYNYDPTNPFPPVLFSSPVIKAAVPQYPNAGVRYLGVAGDTLTVTHSGPGDGSVVPIVVDPSKVTGHAYNVTFQTDNAGATTWSVVDKVLNKTVLSGQENQLGDANYLTADGVQVKVIGPPPGMKEFLIPSGARRFSPVGGFTGLGLEGFSSAADPTAYDPENGTIGMAMKFAFGGIGTTLQNPLDYHTVLLKLAAVDTPVSWNPLVAQTDTNFSRAYRWLRAAANPPADPSFAPWIINPASGYPYQDFNYAVPFSAWDMSTTPPTRLAVGMMENNVVGASVDGRYWPPDASTGDNTVNREFAFILNTPYSTTPNPDYEVNIFSNSSLPFMWIMTCTRRSPAPWPGNDEFEIVANKVNSPADVFAYTAPAIDTSHALAVDDVKKVNVFPNPYYGLNSQEPTRLNKFVTFSHLPTTGHVMIRVFNLAGVLVKTIDHTATPYAGTQFEQWDLRNDSHIPVASGIYIVYVDMPGFGSKILKLALVQEEQVLPAY